MADRDEEFKAFFEAEFRPLRRLGYLLTGDWIEAEDLAQEAMVRTYRAWSRIRERERPGAYARSVLVNRRRSMLRRSMVVQKHAEMLRSEEYRRDSLLIDPTASPATTPKIYVGSYTSSTLATVKNWYSNWPGDPCAHRARPPARTVGPSTTTTTPSW